MSTAWVTLATNDGYAIGAMVLAHSLRLSGTRHQLHVMYTEGVSQPVRERLQNVFDHTSLVNVLDSNDTENLELIGRPDLGVTFTKLHCWRLTQYSKCVFLDADTLIIQNSDELFDRPEFAAAPDIGWPDFFNSGVFVFVPSSETYHSLLQFALKYGSFDGGDQGLLNQYYANWREMDANHRLPFIYNVTSGAIYSYAAALKKFGSAIKIVHFLGSVKPWHNTDQHGFVDKHWALWQQIYHEKVKEVVQEHVTNPWYVDFDRSSLSRIPVSQPEKVDSGSFVSGVPSVDYSAYHETQPPPQEYHHHHETQQWNPPPEQNWPQSQPEAPQPPFLDLTIDQVVTKEERYSAWDQGIPDYTGKDAFANIQKQIEASLQEKLVEAKVEPLPRSPKNSPEPTTGETAPLPVHEAPQPGLEPEHESSETGKLPQAVTPPPTETIPGTDTTHPQSTDPIGHALQETAAQGTISMESQDPNKPTESDA
uniref:Glycogenin n=1 Tax=Panagrolaimus sp. JU765 TaxID=591449 RepID=A0AC34QPC2_9BILA